MKLLLLCLSVFLFLGAEAKRRDHHRQSRHAKEAWEAWKSRFDRSYDSAAEERRRFSNYLSNMRFIAGHRLLGDPDLGHELGENQLMDMNLREFSETMNGWRVSEKFGMSLAEGHGASFMEPSHVRIPESKDWRDEGYVTKVKNQGHCGSCWSFSATGSLEGQHFRKTGRLVSLSEQNLVDCSTSFGNNGCEGGLMDQAFQYIKANDGLDTERSYPYEARDDTCRFEKQDIGADDKGFVDIPAGNETALKIAVATVGPVSVAIDASHRSFQMYKRGVYNEPECDPEALDHGVLVVGYGTDEESGEDYWIVKNSWGTVWGEDGFIRMARNKDNMCGIASKASYPLV